MRMATDCDMVFDVRRCFVYLDDCYRSVLFFLFFQFLRNLKPIRCDDDDE